MGQTYQNILVAVDGSQEAEWAFEKAISITKRNSASLTLVHVIDTRSYATVEAYDRNMTERADTYAEELLSRYKSEAEAAGIDHVKTMIEHGSPKAVIPNQVAKSVRADLIICGATGMSTLERFLIGSVSQHITKSAPCDVLVVRTNKGEVL
ncbi:universal stress protein [Falsibacillus albus]|uniref:Universal stress protein n=1 Tax=Falsibacillus albus TaxID=2478915 RepID=A0A3L7K5R0_9BACI|nr:universal stress protein [Falsibacillus albus]RLQ97945.1 universal stress protein [Falsibacillus albus]